MKKNEIAACAGSDGVITKNDHAIADKIRMIRGVQVMLDRDIAELYGVETRVLNQAVKRNAERFPEDFMFQLDKDECLRSQIVILKEKQGRHLKYMPYAFTENGVAMLSGILRTEKFHDRFLIIDNAELHNLGSSINCLGRRVTTYTTRDPKEIAKVQSEI